MQDAAAAGTETAPATACKHDPAFHMAAKPACACQKLIWPRRIHAALGLFLAAFLAVHLGLCVAGLNPAGYQRGVDGMERLTAAMPGLVLFAIFLPFAVQTGYGLFLLNHHGLKYNVKKCNRGGKLRFYLQRTSGLAIVAFLLMHVGTLHAWGLHLLSGMAPAALARYAQGGLFTPQGEAFRTTVLGLNRTWSASGGAVNGLLLGFTALALWATAFHIANGAWSGGLAWKIQGTLLPKPVWAVLCCVVGVGLAAVGSAALWAFTFSPAARAVLAQ